MFTMRKIDPTELWFHILNALFRARNQGGHPLRKADKGVVEAAARVAFDEIFRTDQRILIEPDRVALDSARHNPLAFSHDRPGLWGEDEPLPRFSNDPPPPPVKRSE